MFENSSIFVAIFLREKDIEVNKEDSWAFITLYKIPNGRGFMQVGNIRRNSYNSAVFESEVELISMYKKVKYRIATGKTIPPSIPGVCVYEGAPLNG